jgi:nucleotide-binding universal stress UspA family protein
MEALFHKILCPVDFSRISIPALELARKLARQNGASVHLLCVIPPASASEPDVQRFAEDSLRAVAHKWFAGKMSHEIAVRIGEPAHAILAAAEELGADVILMATHGRTGEDRARLGSVTEQVVRHSTRPVVTIRPG